MLRRLAPLPVALALLGAVAALPAHGDGLSTANPPAGLPSGVPAAALAPEPTLPTPAPTVWPFPDAFPRTMGTGRTVPGAVEWTDFMYDDHGAKGVPRSFPIAGLAPTAGTYEYSGPKADKNGADLFRIGMGEDAAATYWRVDWTTLEDPDEPIASFGLDTAPAADTVPNFSGPGLSTDAWPGIPGLHAQGIDEAIMLSSRGAWLVDPAGNKTALPAPTVDLGTQSFILKVPKATMPVSGPWKVWVVSGEANAAGDGFAPVDSDHGALSGQPPVFNVGFRTKGGERPFPDNYWMESGQATNLALGDVTTYSRTVHWRALRSATDSGEPQPVGFSNRWYVSSIAVGTGQGVVADGPNNPTGDTLPNYLGRVQPYNIYVPRHYQQGTPTPLTWLLHSLSEQHNQYEVLAPTFVYKACELRTSICVTPLGRGPDGWYYNEAELDFWEVWNRVAATYTLDPERTVLAGYSMGGWGTYKLGFEHPDLFANAVVLAGPPGCGARLADPAGTPVPLQITYTGTDCASDGDSTPLISNARWLPYFIGHGTEDELVPVTSAVEQANAFQTAGNQFRFELYPGMDHMAWGASDMFGSAAAHMGNLTREHRPDHITFDWYPHLDSRWQFTTGAYWIRDPQAPVDQPGLIAKVDAVSGMAGQPTHTTNLNPGISNPLDGPPVGASMEQDWVLGSTPPPTSEIDLNLSKVTALTVDVAGAGFQPGQEGILKVTTDTTVTVHTSAGDLTFQPGTAAASFLA
jgi:pimeloyl-ACP methyl ester carboxylesterase